MNSPVSFKARITCSGHYLENFPPFQTDATSRSAAQTLDHMMALGPPLKKDSTGCEILFKITPGGYQLFLIDHHLLGNNCLAFEHGYLGAFIPARKNAATFLLQPEPQIETGAVFKTQLLSIADNKIVGLKQRKTKSISQFEELSFPNIIGFSVETEEPAVFDIEITEVLTS